MRDDIYIQETDSGVPCSSGRLRHVSHAEHMRMCDESTRLVKSMQAIKEDHDRRWEGAVKITTDVRQSNGNTFYWVDKNGKRLIY
jgi:hypothetical protein